MSEERLKKWLSEAINEIERLRSALSKIEKDQKNCADHCRRQARRALSDTSQLCGGDNV